MNKNQQKSRVVILALSGLMLSASVGAWVYYNQSRSDDTYSYPSSSPSTTARGPRIGNVRPVSANTGSASRSVPVAMIPVPIPQIPITPSVVPSGGTAVPIGPGPQGAPLRQPPGVNAGAATTGPLGAAEPPVNQGFASRATPSVASSLNSAVSDKDAAARAQRALDLYRKRKQSELYAFLFNNGPPPKADSPPSTVVGAKGEAVVPSTTRLQAAADARKSIALSDDPYSGIDQKDWKPFAVGKPKVATNWRSIVMGKDSGPRIPGAPEPSFPEVPMPPNSPSLVPPLVPGDGGTIAIEQLPPPPERPAVNLDDWRLTAIIGDTAMFRNGRTEIVLTIGDKYEGLMLTKITASAAILDDGYRSYTKTL